MEKTVEDNEKDTYHLLEENKCCSRSPLIFVYLFSVVTMISAITIIVWWIHTSDVNEVSVEIVSRDKWGAKSVDPAALHSLRVNPPTHVVILHTNGDECYSFINCSHLVQKLQEKDMVQLPDIAYNFLIGNDGRVYEGRGWGIAGMYAARIQEKSVGIAVIGNYDTIQPSGKVLKICQLLIQESVRRKKLDSNYKLIGARQVAYTNSPGEKLFNIIKTWNHWEDCTGSKEC